MNEASQIEDAAMRAVYDEVKTPFKYGIVLRAEAGVEAGADSAADGAAGGAVVDCPSIFRHSESWYMVYVCMGGLGYETFLATSDNLVDWRKLGRILSFARTGWDAWQSGGGLALLDHEWGGSCAINQYNGRYWISYIGGALQGYETDPLSIGMAWTDRPTEAREWTRFAENPVLTPDQPGARDFEQRTLYRSNIIWDKAETLGSPFVMFYNGKNRHGHERIGMAVSRDMTSWSRYGTGPVVANGDETKAGITGDPQIVRMGDLWVMFYFGAFWKPNAFDTFACSRDLVSWTSWTGPHLIEPSEPWDATFAHKPWVVKHEGVVYHFYCAVGDQGRAIALATSREVKRV